MTENNDQQQSPGFLHRIGVTTDGVYKGLITGVSSFGLLVDAVDHAPKILNILPGEQGFSTISGGDPVGGYDHLHRNLTGIYNSYNDVAGVDVPEPVDLTDHFLRMGGEVAGGLIVAGGASTAIKSSALATNAVQTTASALTATQGSTAVGAGRTVLGTAWQVASIPYKVGKIVLATGTAATATVGAGAAIDIGLNDGRVTTAAVRHGTNFVASQAIGAVENMLGIDNLSETFNSMVPEGMKNALGDGMAFLGENEQIAKWGSFAVAFMMGRSVLGTFTGNGLMSTVATLAVAGTLAWGLSEMFKDKAVEMANQRHEPDRENIGATDDIREEIIPPQVTFKGLAPA